MIAKDRGTLGSCTAAATLVALISGTAVAQPANPSATRVTAERSLAGYKAMSVDVDGTGSFADQKAFMSVMEEQLRSFGVAILPPAALPVLRLRVGRQTMTGPDGGQLLYTLRLEFEQLVTLAGSQARQAAAVTWQSSELVGLNSLGIERRGVVQVLNEFGAAYKRAAAAASPSTSTKVSPPPTAPPIHHLGNQRYGRVPDDYVPPMPASFSSGELRITMEKETPGALIEIHVGGVTSSTSPGTDTPIVAYLRGRDPIDPPHRRGGRRAINRESKGHSVIACTSKADVVPRQLSGTRWNP